MPGGWVVVAGGDGTVHEVANGLAGTAGVMSVLPLGTGNDFAAAVGTPAGLAEAVGALGPAPTLRLDLGHVRWTDTDGRASERRFANCLGMGFDAHAAALAAETKWLGGRAAYLAAVVRTLWARRRPDLCASIRADGLDFDGPLFLCEVGNGHSIGGGFLITPDARPRRRPPRRLRRPPPRPAPRHDAAAPDVHGRPRLGARSEPDADRGPDPARDVGPARRAWASRPTARR